MHGITHLLFLIGLSIAASVSPLLTLSYLWQIKEWRIDRVREHLKQEGFFVQMWGKVRPVIGVGGVITTLLLTNEYAVLVTLLTYCALNVVQLLMRKQSLPTWTQKTVLITICALGYTTIAAGILSMLTVGLLVLPLLQPVTLALAWITVLPIDTFLKQRIYARATELRRAHPETIVIGITGSVGKTTTKELLAHVLASKGAVATPAYMNAEVGLARWLTTTLSQEQVPKILIVEMGAYRIGEIAKLMSIAKPQIGVLTFIGTQHLGLFGSQEALASAKGEILAGLPEDGHGFINADSSLTETVRHLAKCPVTSVGTGGHADIEAYDIEETAKGVRFRIGDYTCEAPIHGTHNVTNVLLTMSVAKHLGMTEREMCSALQSFKLLDHTFNVRKERGVTVLDDTHNASAASFRAAIAWARMQPHSSKTLLTPGLIELGSVHDVVHTELGGLASTVFDRVIFTEKHGKAAFEKGFGKPVELLQKDSTAIGSESLLACIGRVSESSRSAILPTT